MTVRFVEEVLPKDERTQRKLRAIKAIYNLIYDEVK